MQGEQPLDFQNVIAAAEAEQGGSEQIDAGAPPLLPPGRCVMAGLSGSLRPQKPPQQLIKRF